MSLAQYKMFKQTAEADRDRGAHNAHKAGVAGALASLLLTRGKAPAPNASGVSKAVAAIRATPLRRAAAGYVGGQLAVGGVRMATEGTKDVYGDRSHKAKIVEKAPMWAGLIGAGLLAERRLKNFSAVEFGWRDVANKIGAGTLAGSVVGAARRFASNAVVKGVGARLPEVGAIAAGDLIAEKVHDDLQKKKQARQQEMSAVMLAVRSMSYGPVIHLSREQLRDEKWVHIDPMAAASGEVKARKARVDHNGNYVRDRAGKIITDPHNVTIAHAQVLRAAYNKGMTYQRYGRRGVGLTKDAIGALKGEKKVDERGRPLKREWEKAWFKNAAGAVAVGAGLLAHAHIMRTNPNYRKRVVGVKNEVKGRINKIIPDSFPKFDFSPVGLIMLDAYAEMKGWDVRDPRGRSARVFAPGSRQRERRDKKWHERVSNIRKLALVGTAAGLAVGGTAGYLIGRRAPSIRKPMRPVRTSAAVEHAAGKVIDVTDELKKHVG